MMGSPRFLSDIFPEEHADLSWVPDGMDPNSSYRFAARVGAFVKLTEDGKREYCDACNIAKILDRDTTNWNDLLLDIGTEIKLDSKHKLRVTYWDNMSRSYEEIDSVNKLLHVIDMYWEIRRLSVQVRVMIKDDFCLELDIGRQQNMPCVLQGSTDAPANQLIAQPTFEIESSLVEPPVQNNPGANWVHDDVEYVGLDDEDPYKSLLSDLSDSESDGDVEDDECVGLEDYLLVEDARDCETVVHATDLENPTIEVGVTFGDGDTFKKAIRQYAIKGEYEIAAAYSESTRYRAYCKAGRPRKRRFRSSAEGGSGKRTTRCKRCKQLGHMAKTCNEYVYDSDAPPPAAPKPKRKRGKKSVTVVPSSAAEPPQEQSSVAEPPQEQPSCVDPFATPTKLITSGYTPSPVTRSMTRKLLELESSTPTRVITSVSTPSPVTRGRKRLLELEDAIEPVGCPITSPFCVEKGKVKKLKVVRSKKT